MAATIQTGNVVEPLPSLEQWHALYAAACEYQRLACWQWLADSDLFAVRDPGTGVPGYCAVFGNAGEMFGLAVYLGEAGWASYFALAAAQDDARESVMQQQTCLIGSFGARDLLDDADRKVIKQLGLEFRGPRAWPQFRSHRPGYLPWRLTQTEAATLTTAFQQATIVGGRMKDNLELHIHQQRHEILVRELDTVAGATPVWRESWQPLPAVKPPEPEPPPLLEEKFVNELRRLPVVPSQVWEVDVALAPVTVGERGHRPYVPLMLWCVAADSGFILLSHMVEPANAWRELWLQLGNVMAEAKARPAEFHVQGRQSGDWLFPMAEALRTPLYLARCLPALNAARQEMSRMFARRS
jgi:hypothetical protein